MNSIAEEVVNYLLKRDYIKVDEREFYIFTFGSNGWHSYGEVV